MKKPEQAGNNGMFSIDTEKEHWLRMCNFKRKKINQENLGHFDELPNN